MSYEDEFAAMEAQLQAEERGQAPVATAVAPPVAPVNLDNVRSGEVYYIPDITQVSFNETHGISSFSTNNGIRNFADLKSKSIGYYLKVQDTAQNIFSAYLINENPTEDLFIKAILVLNTQQPEGALIKLDGDEKIQYAKLSNTIESFREDAEKRAAEEKEAKRLEAVAKEEERLKKLADGKATTRELWAELLNAIYGEEYWDINSANNLIIYFPEVEVTNSRNESHTVRDLYVRWPLTNELAPSGSITGFRGLKTIEEFESGYNHSHLSTGAIQDWGNTWCLGHTDFGALINGLNADRDLNWTQIQEALLMINMYVGWESLEGGPYTTIREIKRRSSTRSNPRSSISDGQLKNIYDQWMSTIDGEQIAKIQEAHGVKLFRANRDVVNTGLVSAVSRVLGDAYIDVVSPDGRHTPLYIAQQSANSSDQQLADSYNREMRNCGGRTQFKGQTITPKIYIPGADITPEDAKEYKKVPMKIVTEYAINKFENDLNMHVINKPA